MSRQIPAEFVPTFEQAFQESSSAIRGTDWNERERIAYEKLIHPPTAENAAAIKREDIYLGGDLLRPYLSVCVRNKLWLISKSQPILSKPRLLAEFDSGLFGTLDHINETVESTTSSLSVNQSLSHRLNVPRVYLVSLTNPSKYQTRRYPLNVARLAQWLRFQHAGRVLVADLALNFEGDLRAISNDVVTPPINSGGCQHSIHSPSRGTPQYQLQ